MLDTEYLWLTASGWLSGWESIAAKLHSLPAGGWADRSSTPHPWTDSATHKVNIYLSSTLNSYLSKIKLDIETQKYNTIDKALIYIWWSYLDTHIYSLTMFISQEVKHYLPQLELVNPNDERLLATIRAQFSAFGPLNNLDAKIRFLSE